MTNRGKFKLGVGAIAWTNPGTPEFSDSYTAEQIISQMSELGYEGTEMNRKYPADYEALNSLLDRYNMKISSQYKFVIFSNQTYVEDEMESFKQHADFLHRMGCKYVIVSEQGGSAHWDPVNGDSGVITPLTEETWAVLIENLHIAGEYCRQLDMRLVYHYHAGTVIEQHAEIDYLMDHTDAEKLSLLFDTGHAYYGNYDPLELCKKHYQRIHYIHLKDVRKAVLERARKENIDFKQGVVEGIFTVPGDGDLDFEPIFKILLKKNYDSWIIVEAEQNPNTANPYEYAKMAKRYIDHTVSNLGRGM
jgi:inosose dehydratase